AAEVHQESAVAVDRDDLAVRQAERDAERDRRGEPERARAEIGVAGPERLPFARRPSSRDDESIPDIGCDRLQIIVALHHSTSNTSRVRRIATGRRESSASICAPRIVCSTSSGLRRIYVRSPSASSTGSVTEPTVAKPRSPKSPA